MSRSYQLRHFAVVALLLIAGAAAAQDNTEAPDCIKGTVEKITATVLYLQDATFPDETLGKRDVTVNLDKDTKYFDGTRVVARDDLLLGKIVLVFWTLEGKERKANIIRIIGEKTP